MAKNKQQQIAKPVAPVQQAAKVAVEVSSQNTIPAWLKFAPIIVLIVTALAHFVGLGNGWVTLDDELYLINNQSIRTLSAESIAEMFKLSSSYGGNYHPLVELSNAIEFSLFGDDWQKYHILNWLLHIANTYLVFVFIKLLSKGNIAVAGAVALLFGIHPMHVESVAWLSERKDVLYSFFYLLALISYLRYKANGKMLFFVLTAVAFVLSCLSKSMAVTLPVVLMGIDYYYDEKFELKSSLKHLVFFAISLVFGLLALKTQSDQNYIGAYNFNILQKILISCYAFVYYIIKMFAPINQCVLVPFEREGLSTMYYLAPLAVAGIAFLLYKAKGLTAKVLRFGFWFYLGSIFIVLQFVSVGAAVVCERYTYMPYIGLFFALCMWCYNAISDSTHLLHGLRKMFLPLMCIIAIAFAAATHMRTQVWKDGTTLWKDGTSKQPQSDYSWFGLGNSLKNDYSRMLAERYPNGVPNPQPADVVEQQKEIIAAYNTCLSINNTMPNYLINSSVAKSEFGDKKGALAELDKAYSVKPQDDQVLFNRGGVRRDLGDLKGSIEDYTALINLKPQYANAYFQRAISYKTINQFDAAIADYQKVIAIDSKFNNVYTNLGNVYFAKQDMPTAIQFYNKELAVSPKDANSLRNRGVANFAMGKKQEACADLQAAASLGHGGAAEDIKHLCVGQ
jgi:protein O-mannosyl-transferase